MPAQPGPADDEQHEGGDHKPQAHHPERPGPRHQAHGKRPTELNGHASGQHQSDRAEGARSPPRARSASGRRDSLRRLGGTRGHFS
ncbi:hypothetical protein GCM10023080_068660 [Streptomyces pseudoechinosporeus]